MDLQQLQLEIEFRKALHTADAGDEKQAIRDLTQLAVRTRLMGHIHAEILRARAQLLYQNGAVFLALLDLQHCLRIGRFNKRDRTDLLLLLANCCAEMGRPKLVARILRQACSPGILSARSALKTLHNFGVRCNLRGDSNLGFEYFNFVIQNEAIASSWVFCNALINRGCWFGSEGHYDFAEDDFLRAIANDDIAPELYVRATFNLGNLYWVKGEYSKAIKSFASIVEVPETVDDLRPLARCKMAHSYERLGQHETALKVLNDGDPGTRVCSAENRATIALYSGIVLLGSKRFAEAESRFVDVFSRTSSKSVVRARCLWAYGYSRCLQDDIASGVAKMHEARSIFEVSREQRLLTLIDEDIKRFSTRKCVVADQVEN